MLALPPPQPQPLQRFQDINEALMQEYACWENPQWLRIAAIAGTMAPGSANAVADQIRAEAAKLKQLRPWMDTLGSHERFVYAASLVAAGSSAAAFIADMDHCREVFRRVGLHARSPQAILAMLILHLDHPGAVPEGRIGIIKVLFDLMKSHHWWITSEDDLPLCTMLSHHHGTPEDISGRMERIFSKLRGEGLQVSSPLQSSAAILALGEQDTNSAVANFISLFREIQRRCIPLERQSYESFAILSLLHEQPQQVLDTFERTCDALRVRASSLTLAWITAVSADLTVIDTLRIHPHRQGVLPSGTFANLIIFTAMDAIRNSSMPCAEIL